MLLAALNEVIASEDWDVEGEMPSATVHRRDAEPLAFNAGNKNDVALPDFEPRSRDAHDTNGDRAYCLQGNMIGRTAKSGPQGNGVNDEIAFTLNTVDRHAVSFRREKDGR